MKPPIDTRTSWLRSALAITAMLTVAGCATPRSENVVLIVVDTLRVDHIGVYGYDRPTTPNLDNWARRGTIFDHALATSPWTLPTFGSILTGLLPSEHGAGWPRGKNVYLRTGLVPEVETLPLILSRAGFATGAVVGNPFLNERLGIDRGFEQFLHQTNRPANRTVDEAIRWLDARKAKRFFLMVHFMDPHLPYRAPEPFLGRFSKGEPQRFAPPHEFRRIALSLPPAEREYVIDRYDEEIAFVDHELGRLLAKLEGTDDTLVILTADHGEELWDHGGFEHGHTMLQELLRVPLVIVGPGVTAKRIGTPVTLADIPSTVLKATKVETALSSDSPLVGQSLWNLLSRPRTESRRDPVSSRNLWAETMLYGADRKVLVQWPYKLILNPRTGGLRLFDLEHDPREERDLAQENRETAARMETAVRDRLLIHRPARGPALPAEDDTVRSLRTLGYVN